MHIGSLLYFSLFLPFVLHPATALRAQRASRKSLAHLKQVLNDDFASLISTRQNDQVDPFADLRSNPKARRNKDELSINDPEDYFQGDVDLSEQQVLQIEKAFTEGHREKRKIGRVPLYKLWDRTRAISFDFTEAIKYRAREKIRQAMNLWQNNTCIRFDEGGPNVDRLEFFDGGGCSSFVGCIGGTQGISIATPGCDVVGIISHEIGHALGIFHEQARPDQENHISVNYNNVPISRWNNFQSIGPSHAETYGLPYDTGSVMHYGPYGFASDPHVPTIRTLERGQQSTIGQRAGPSFLDFQAINVAYGCIDHCPPMNCLHNGYPHPKDCSICACPEGLTGSFCETLQHSTGACGGVLLAHRIPQYITTPNYPNGFTEGVECYWILRAASGGHVFMEFVDAFEFLCEDTCDKSYVEVKYYSDKRLTGSRHCCSRIPNQLFASFDNEILVLMRGHIGGYRGFRARFWSNTPEPTVALSTLQPKDVETVKEITKDISLHLSGVLTEKTGKITTSSPKILQTSTKGFQTVLISLWKLYRTTTPSLSFTNSTSGFKSLPTMKPEPSTISPLHIQRPRTTDAPVNRAGEERLECNCGDWSEWTRECTQQCGGCGHRTRTRKCQMGDCRNEEARPCNFTACPSGTNFLINNGEFHILWRGCCIGLFRSGDQCTVLEAEQNPFLRIITSLLNIHDSKQNSTENSRKLQRGEH